MALAANYLEDLIHLNYLNAYAARSQPRSFITAISFAATLVKYATTLPGFAVVISAVLTANYQIVSSPISGAREALVALIFISIIALVTLLAASLVYDSVVPKTSLAEI